MGGLLWSRVRHGYSDRFAGTVPRASKFNNGRAGFSPGGSIRGVVLGQQACLIGVSVGSLLL